MSKLIYILDIDGVWKVVPLQADASFGYIIPNPHTVFPIVNNFGFILEAYMLSGQELDSRLLCYNTFQKKSLTQTNSAGKKTSFDFFDLVELFPYTKPEQLTVTKVAGVMSAQERALALETWNTMNATAYTMPSMVLVSEQALHEAMYTMQSTQLTVQQLQLRNRWLQTQLNAAKRDAARRDTTMRQFRSLSSPSSQASSLGDERTVELAASAATSPRYADDTSPRFKPKEFTDKPNIADTAHTTVINTVQPPELTSTAVVAPPQPSAIGELPPSASVNKADEQTVQAKALDKKIRKQEQEKLLLDAQAQFTDLLRSETEVQVLHNYILTNESLKALDHNGLLKFITSSNLSSKMCIALLVQGRKNEDKKNQKLNGVLLKILSKYTDENFDGCEIPQVIVKLAADLFKDKDKSIADTIKQLAKKYAPVVEKSAAVTTVQTTFAEPIVAVTDTKTPVIFSAVKPAPIIKLKPIEQIVAAITDCDVERFNALITQHSTLIDDVTKLVLDQLRSNASRMATFFNAVQLPAQSYIFLINETSKHQHESTLTKLIVKKTLTLTNLDIIVIFEMLKQYGPSNVYLSSLQKKDLELYQEYINVYNVAGQEALDDFTGRLAMNAPGILKEINKYPQLYRGVNSERQSLLMVAISNTAIHSREVCTLLAKYPSIVGIKDNAGYTVLDYWARSRAKEKDLTLFAALCKEYATEIHIWLRDGLGQLLRSDLKPSADLSALFHGLLIKNSGGQTFLHTFLEQNKDIDKIAEVLKILKPYFWETIGLFVLVKNDAGENIYTMLEKMLLDMSEDQCKNFATKIEPLLDFLSELRKLSFNELDGVLLPPNYFTNDMIDFFNMQERNSIVTKLLDKLPERKATTRLQTLMQIRHRIRGDLDIAWFAVRGRKYLELKIVSDLNFSRYYGVHEIHSELMYIFQTESESDKAISYINNWLKIESEQSGNLLYTTLFDLSICFQREHPDLVAVNSNMQILSTIFKAQPELIQKATNYTTVIKQTCLLKVLHMMMTPEGESKLTLKLLDQVLRYASINILKNVDKFNCNFMHVIAIGYPMKKYTAKTLEVIRKHVPMEILVDLLQQKNSDKLVPFHEKLAEADEVRKMRTEILAVLFQPEKLKKILATLTHDVDGANVSYTPKPS